MRGIDPIVIFYISSNNISALGFGIVPCRFALLRRLFLRFGKLIERYYPRTINALREVDQLKLSGIAVKGVTDSSNLTIFS